MSNQEELRILLEVEELKKLIKEQKQISDEKDNKIAELTRVNLRLNVEIQQLKANSIKNNLEILSLIDKVRNTLQ